MRQHNEKRDADLSKVSSKVGKPEEEEDDDSYEVTLDDDFLTALEYGMPPASGMVKLRIFCYLKRNTAKCATFRVNCFKPDTSLKK